jgi:hypothetical protein
LPIKIAKNPPKLKEMKKVKNKYVNNGEKSLDLDMTWPEKYLTYWRLKKWGSPA